MNAKQLVEFAADLRLDVPGAKLALLVAVEGFESAEITRLRAEVEALRADAERYRWIRDGSNPPWVMQMLERYADNGSDFDAEVDAEVDAARAVQGDKT